MIKEKRTIFLFLAFFRFVIYIYIYVLVSFVVVDFFFFKRIKKLNDDFMLRVYFFFSCSLIYEFIMIKANNQLVVRIHFD